MLEVREPSDLWEGGDAGELLNRGTTESRTPP